MKPTKADRETAQELVINFRHMAALAGGSAMLAVIARYAVIIARHRAPERKLAHRIGTELALHQHEVKKLRELARRERHAADGLLERLDKRIKGCCGYGGKSCVVCRPDISATATYEAIVLGSQLAAAEALDTDKGEGA